jgi:hypothetical protein
VDVVAVRALGALLVLTTGALHLYLWFDYFHRVHVVGALFLANFACGVAVAVVLVLSGSAPGVLAGLGYSAGTLVAFGVSAKWGLFGYHERFWGSWQEAAGVVELAAALLLAALLVVRSRQTGFARLAGYLRLDARRR